VTGLELNLPIVLLAKVLFAHYREKRVSGMMKKSVLGDVQSELH
jgi:hypothetical protein